jgi:hypothetical protein
MVLYGVYVCDFYVDTLIHYYWYFTYPREMMPRCFYKSKAFDRRDKDPRPGPVKSQKPRRVSSVAAGECVAQGRHLPMEAGTSDWRC